MPGSSSNVRTGPSPRWTRRPRASSTMISLCESLVRIVSESCTTVASRVGDICSPPPFHRHYPVPAICEKQICASQELQLPHQGAVGSGFGDLRVLLAALFSEQLASAPLGAWRQRNRHIEPTRLHRGDYELILWRLAVQIRFFCDVLVHQIRRREEALHIFEDVRFQGLSSDPTILFGGASIERVEQRRCEDATHLTINLPLHCKPSILRRE